jgi:hypothetical protein
MFLFLVKYSPTVFIPLNSDKDYEKKKTPGKGRF